MPINEAAGWTIASDRLPRSGEKVLVICHNTVTEKDTVVLGHAEKPKGQTETYWILPPDHVLAFAWRRIPWKGAPWDAYDAYKAEIEDSYIRRKARAEKDSK